MGLEEETMISHKIMGFDDSEKYFTYKIQIYLFKKKKYHFIYLI